MTATVTDAGPFEKLVTFTVAEQELEAAKASASRRLSRDLKIKGFRPGKAPRPVVEAAVGAARLRSEAIEEILPRKLSEALDEAELAPAVNPELESLDDTDDGVEVQVKVTLWPTLERVPEHRGRVVEVGSPEVSEEELGAQIDRMRDQYAQLETVDRPAADGDYVAIDIAASHEGEPVPEAAASDLLYQVGSGQFLEGIDDVLAGAAAETEVSFAGTLPEGFGDRAGLAVQFTVAVKEVKAKVLPDLTDEWVSEVTEFETVEEMRVALLDQMSDLKRRSLANRFREQALEGLVEEVDLLMPEALVRAEMDELLHRFAHRLEDQKITLDDYFGATGVTQEDFLEDLRRQADSSLRTRLLLEAVAEQEGIDVEGPEIEEIVTMLADRSGKPDAFRQAFAGSAREESLRADILRSKALDAVVAGATPVDEEGRPVDLAVVAGEQTTEEEYEAEIVAEGEVVEAEIVEASEEE